MTTKKKTKKKAAGSRDIPLANIPERMTHKSYSAEEKLAAVMAAKKGGKSLEELARELGISNGGVIAKWVQQHDAGLPFTTRGGLRPGGFGKTPKAGDFMVELRAALARAHQARDDRLEMAAYIAEVDTGDVKQGAEIAKRIRSFKRPAKPT